MDWIIRIDEDGEARYLYEVSANGSVWVPYPEDARTFGRAGARAALARVGPRPSEGLRAVRRSEEIASSSGASHV